MTITRGQKSTLFTSASNGGAVTWSVNPTAGQKILIAVWTSAGESVTSVIDNGVTPTTYTLDLAETDNAGQLLRIYRADNITLPAAGSYTATITASGGTTVVAGGIAYSGVSPGSPTISINSNTTGTAISTNTTTPSFAGALFFAAFTNNAFVTETINLTAGTFTSQFSETAGASFAPGAVADKIDAAGPAATGCTWTVGTSASWAAGIAAYDAAFPTVALQASWSGSAARDPVIFAPGPPPLTPLAVPVTNTAGSWLVAVASWRQDAGTAGVLLFPSTISVSDDAGNFWIPVYSGLPAADSSPAPVTGIIRIAVWVAPAARQAEFVFFSPTAYQSSLVGQVFEFAAACPWYQIQVKAQTFVNQGTSITESLTLPSGVLAVGALAWDNNSLGVTQAAPGWTALPPAAVTNGNDHTGDLTQAPYTVTGTGVSQTLTAAVASTPSIAVTASQVNSFAPGITLAVRVVTGAQHAAAQAANAALNAVGIADFGATTPQGTITPNGTGSFLYMSMIEGGNHTPYTPLASSTFIYNTGDATNNIMPGIVKGTSTTTAGTPVTLGGSAPTGANFFAGIAEILNSTGLAEDGSTPAVVNSTSAINITSPFFSPPSGSLLVALVSSNGSTAAQRITITDSSGLTWYQITQPGPASPQNITSIWVADSSAPPDFAATMVTISGIADARAYPYGTPALENWPVLVTEIASGPALNTDPTFASGTAFWTTDAHATVAAVTQPLWTPPLSSYQPLLYGTVQLTPNNTSQVASLFSTKSPVNQQAYYTGIALVYSLSGFGSAAAGTGAGCSIQWLDGGGGLLSTTAGPVVPLLPGEWTQLQVPPTAPPLPTVVQAQLVIVEQTSGGTTLPASAVLYAAYGALSLSDAYEFIPPDQFSWTDISSRVFTHGDIQITRGIQYEQQSLEAGTLTIYVDNHDGAFTFGNILSVYWPNAGDTDVPVRVRAVWPGSLTPYAPLFSGFTDQIIYGVDPDTRWAFAEIQASDAWSRLTQQMLALVEQEALDDGPVAFMSCNQNGANIIAAAPFNIPVVQILSSIAGQLIIAPPTASFAGGAISLPGASGLACWQSGGTKAATAAGTGNVGFALAWVLNTPLLVTPLGTTFEFWWSPVSVAATQATQKVIVCAATASENNLVWVILADNSAPAAPYSGYLILQTFDVNGRQVSSAAIAPLITPYSSSSNATAPYYFAVSWTQSTMTVVVNPGDPLVSESVTVTGQNFPVACTGALWGGGTGIHSNFGDTAIADIAVFDYAAPPARIASRYQAGVAAYVSESDNFRLARITGYSQFIPVLGMRGQDLPVLPAADVDIMTGATDTNTQVVSAYFTNIAQTTLAALFVNGAGTLIYRRRLEWYNRPIGQWVLGEDDSQLLSLNVNPLNASASVTGWTTGNSAALVTGNAPAGGPLFAPFAGLFSGNGSTANPFIITSSNPAVTPGGFYQFTVWLFSNQGWTTGGVNAQLQFFNASNAQVGSTQSSPVVNIAAGSIAYATAGPVRAPAAAAYLKAVVQVNGTPSSSAGFYVAAARAYQVLPDTAAGANVAVPEAPYEAGYQVSSDRAQQFNYAVLTQYGTNLVSSFSGTSVLFTPSSGIIVITSNVPSIALRGQVPYTSTIYSDNTAQGIPYYLGDGSIEDTGNWITQTLGAPLLRPDRVSITPAATPAALLPGIFAEVGDTVMFRRRQLGAPPLQILTYISKITHNIDIAAGQWTVAYELSPFPGGQILGSDDVVHGVLTGESLLGW